MTYKYDGVVASPQRHRSGVRGWVNDRRAPIASALVLLVLLGLVYWTIATQTTEPPTEPAVLLRLIRDAIPSACVGLVIYLIINYVLYQQRVESARQYADDLVHHFIDSLGDQHTGLHQLIYERAKFNWAPLIESAETITILTRHWDDEATFHRRAFIDFFKGGGRVELLIPNPQDVDSRRIAAEQRSAALTPHDAQIAQRILRTIVEFRAAAVNANNELPEKAQCDPSDRVAVRYIRHAPNYECQLFDEADLIFTPYPHFFMPEAPCPAMWFDLRYADEVREFIRCDLHHLKTSRSQKIPLDDALARYQRLRKQVPDLGDGTAGDATPETTDLS